jgi:hypothetical protein
LTEIKTHYNLFTSDLAELNRVLNQIANRLDALEGLRGTPTFHANLDIKNNKITNVTDGSASGEVLTFPATITDFSNANHDHENAAGGGKLDHGDALTGLTIGDDHNQYLILSGRSGGQVINDIITIGNTTTGNYLTINNGTVTIYSDNQIVHKIEGGS